jgi:hypothetical protein
MEMTHQQLQEASRMIEVLIAKTPTGEARNTLTDINILVLKSMQDIEESSALELSRLLKKILTEKILKFHEKNHGVMNSGDIQTLVKFVEEHGK